MKNVRFLFLTLLLVFFSLSTNADGLKQNSRSTFMVRLPSGNLVAAGGVGSFYSNYFREAAILRISEDNGKTWSLVESYQFVPGRPSTVVAMRVGPDGGLYQLIQASDKNDLTFTYKDLNLSFIRKSFDDGKTWEIIKIPLEITERPLVTDFFFAKNRIFVKVQKMDSIYLNSESPYLYSDDKGKTWNTLDFPRTPAGDSIYGTVGTISSDGETLYMYNWNSLARPVLFSSPDLGANWTLLVPPSSFHITGEPFLKFSSTGVLYLLARDRRRDNLYRVHGGQFVNLNLPDLSNYDPTELVVIGEKIYAFNEDSWKNVVLMSSEDGGLNWSRTNFSETYGFHGSFVDLNQDIYLLGDDAYSWQPNPEFDNWIVTKFNKVLLSFEDVDTVKFDFLPRLLTGQNGTGPIPLAH